MYGWVIGAVDGEGWRCEEVDGAGYIDTVEGR